MNKSLHGADVIAAQLDRLVSGDLPEPDRRSLLAWLDEEPTRWRACALAFLEAQVWEQARLEVGGRESEVGSRACTAATSGREGVGASGFSVRAKQPSPSSWQRWLAIAGVMLLAFAAGTFTGRGSVPAPKRPQQPMIAESRSLPSAPGPQLATVSVRTNLDPRLMAQVQLPVEPADQPLAGASSISEYDRKQWERRGYEVVEETRYLPAKMPDGRTVMVPVNRVHLKLKGTPVS